MIPLRDEQKTQLQQDFRRQYGIKKGQSRYLISPAPMKWQAMGKATKDLMLFEEISDDIMAYVTGTYILLPCSIAKKDRPSATQIVIRSRFTKMLSSRNPYRYMRAGISSSNWKTPA
jgi:hypothetical protein